MNNEYPVGVKTESSNCPNGCISGDELVLQGHDRLHQIPGRFAIVKCAKCGLERTNPRPTAETMGAYYPPDYAPYQSQVAEKVNSSNLKSWVRSIFGLIDRQLPLMSIGRLLEVGCASGAYLEQMQSAGWVVEGIEFSESAAAQARTKGLNVQTSSLESATPPVRRVDVIAAWMVLEHLHQPIQCLKMMRSWINNSGYLVASMPDTESLAKFLFGEHCYDLHLPNHLFHYTPKTLKSVLKNSGWVLERVVWQKNCNPLLRSAEYWAEELQHYRILKIVQWLRTSNRAGKLRLLLGWVLGITRQSGRIEIWARPM